MQNNFNQKMTPEAPVLELNQVSFSYQYSDATTAKFGDRILNNINLTFRPGKIHVLSGPSGCGKSTLLQIINGLIPHSSGGRMSGNIMLGDSDITHVSAKLRCHDIGFVMQDPDAQFITFTVEDEIAFGLENFGFSKEEIKKRIHKYLSYINMEDSLKRSLFSLSGGEKQKIALAAVLAMEPGILLLDEPTANLDPAGRREILNLIVRLAKQENITIIMVEHNIDEILNDIDFLYIFDDSGSLLLNGAPLDVRKRLGENEFSQIRRSLPRILWNTNSIKNIWDHKAMIKNDEVLLSIRDVKYAYPSANGKVSSIGDEAALDGISFDIYKNDFVFLTGENGCGKSTLTSLIFNIAKPLSGEILYKDVNISKWRKSELYAEMGLVFQNPELQFLTNQVDDEMMLGLTNSHFSHDEKLNLVSDMLSRFHLGRFSKYSPYALSQGQKRRLSVATMLLAKQSILFLDEPTYGQDYENKMELMQDLVNLNLQGVTIVMITHDHDIIKEFGKRILHIADGKIDVDGDVDDYFNHYFPGV